jgi:hypothetical protein
VAPGHASLRRTLGKTTFPAWLCGPYTGGEDFDAAEDALREALLQALRVWPEHPPRDPARGRQRSRPSGSSTSAAALTLATEEPEARGLLALMLLNHAPAGAGRPRGPDHHTRPAGPRAVGHPRDREGVRVLQSALAVHHSGRYQVEAAIAALHDDAASAEETDWSQILAWYDDLIAITDDPVHQDPAAVLGCAVAVGHVLGAAAGLRETDRLRDVIGERHRWHAVRGHLYELGGDLPAAAMAYARAVRRATNVAERDHLVRRAPSDQASEHPRDEGARPAVVQSSRRLVHDAASLVRGRPTHDRPDVDPLVPRVSRPGRARRRRRPRVRPHAHATRRPSCTSPLRDRWSRAAGRR